MNTSNIVNVPAEARTLLQKGMREACKADGLRQKADKATAGASTLLTEAAIACGSGEAWEALTESYYIEIRSNVGNAATSIGATKGKNGEYLIPAVARTVVSELSKAFKLGTSLFEMEKDDDGNDTDTPTDAPRSFRKVRAANKLAKDEAEAARLQSGNAPLWEMLKLADSIALSVVQFRSNAGWMIENPDSVERDNLMLAADAFQLAVAAVAALAVEAARVAAEAEAEAEKAEKAAGDTIAEAEAATEAEAVLDFVAPTPRKGRARK